jgi:hypothetical protein
LVWLQHAPEWCSLSDVAGRKLFTVSDDEAVWKLTRPRLKALVEEKRAAARRQHAGQPADAAAGAGPST